MNFLEKVIAAVSPSTALARARSLHVIKVLEDHARKYDGASLDRRGKNWRSSPASANTEIEVAGHILRNRSRDLGRNNAYARRSFHVIPNSVIGTGIMPSIRSSVGGHQKALRDLWKTWADDIGCDADRRKTFYTIQRQVMRAVIESGEVLVRRIRDKSAPGVPMRLQVLESDFLDTTRDSMKAVQGQSYILQGIQFNGTTGAREGYWLWDSHPGETNVLRGLTSSFVPASEVLHIYYEERPGQIRGVPFLTAVMMRLRDHEEYVDAQLIRQKIAACFTAFVTDPSDPTPGQTNPNGPIPLERVEPGIIEYLAPGKQVQFGTPPATDNYEEYDRSILQGVAAGAGISYEALTGNYAQVNFSSGRMGWIEFQKQIEDWQWHMIIPLLCQEVWKWFLEAARVKTGRPGLNAFATWTPPRRVMLDPDKEAKGLLALVGGNLASWSESVREMGYDPDELFEMIASDIARFEAAGLQYPTNGKQQKEEPPDGEEPPGGTAKKQPKAKKS